MTAEHGTRSRYVYGKCRCDPCRAANTAAAAEYRQVMRRHRRGKFVPSGPVIAHVEALRAQGVGVRRICVASGASMTTVNRMIGYRCGGTVPAKVLRTTADRILAVTADDSRWVDGTGTARRMRALIAIGHTRVQIAAQADLHMSTINHWVRGERRVTRESADRARAIYDRWWQVFPTGRGASLARGEARRKGWCSPLAWDDTTIDDPTAKPDTGHRPGQWGAPADSVEVAELVAGRLPADAACKASREEAYRLLFADGWTAESVAAQMQVSGRTAQRAKARLSRPPTAEEAAA